MFGSHLSIAGSMCNALAAAQRLSMDTVQVFTKNQQQWRAPALDKAMVKDWSAELKRLGWLERTVSHASYLINLASCKDELWEQSVELMTDEVERCAALSIPNLVFHPGSFTGWTLERGIDRIALACKEIFRRTKGVKVVMCLEGTAGAGSQIGGPFEHLRDLRAAIIASTGSPARVGYCLDTCHLFAAGHDIRTRASAATVLKHFDALCGLEHVRVLHLNDSKGKLASHLDRHEHIGMGLITRSTPTGDFSPSALAASGFWTIVRAPFAKGIPKILETPKETPKEAAKKDPSDLHDAVNLARLRALLARQPAD
jgi:deoxyribonuclease-4